MEDLAHWGSFEVRTLGCKLNTYDTGLLEQQIQKAGFVLKSLSSAPSPDRGTHFCVLNTCAVTQHAVYEALRVGRHFKRRHPKARLVVTGCAAQVDVEAFKDAGIDLIIGNSHKHLLPSLMQQCLKGEKSLARVHRGSIFKHQRLDTTHSLKQGYTRQFVKIQDGCNSFCSFCVIPFARGKSRSLGVKDLERHIKYLCEQGVQEVVLTGVHIGDYEHNGKTLPHLVRRLLATGVPRLRLSSLEPIELTAELLECFEHPNMCPHVHVSLQSANSRVLKAMKRKYTQKEVIKALETLNKIMPHAFVGMDVIAGFIEEGVKEFEDTYNTLSALPWTELHVFPYSPRAKTWAYKFKALPERLRTQRARKLRALSAKRFSEAAKAQVGGFKKVLPLKNGRGISRDYWKVEGSAHLAGPFEHTLRIKDVNSNNILIAY